MSRLKRNLTIKNPTPEQRRRYEARMKQLRQQQQRRRSVASDLVRGKLTAIGNLPPEQRKKLQRDARIQRRKTVRTLREKPNKTAQEKQYLAAVRKMRQQKRRQRMINKQRQDAQNRLTKPKAPARTTRVAQVSPSVAAQRLKAQRLKLARARYERATRPMAAAQKARGKA